MAQARTAGEHPGRRDESLTFPVPRERPICREPGSPPGISVDDREQDTGCPVGNPPSLFPFNSLVGMPPAGRPSETGLAESAGNGQGVVGSRGEGSHTPSPFHHPGDELP